MYSQSTPKKQGVKVLVFILFVILFAAASIIIPQWFINRRVEPTEALPGEVTNIDAVRVLPAVTSYAGEGAQLVSFYAQFVRPDGTLDLEADYEPRPTVAYTFTKPTIPAKNTPPIGSGGGQTGQTLRQSVTVNLTRPGQRYSVTKTTGRFSARYKYTNKGMQKSEGEPRLMTVQQKNTAPICSFQELWRQAKEAGAPSDGVASISYTGSLYTFKVYGQEKGLAFDLNCRIMR